MSLHCRVAMSLRFRFIMLNSCLTKGTSEPKVLTVTLSLQGAASVQGCHDLAIPFRHAELVSASVQTCIVSLFFLRSFSFFVLQAKKENEPKERNSALLKELLKSLFENFRSQEPVNFLQILKKL